MSRFREEDSNAQGDRGASALLVALMLLVFMGFAALAVDAGALYLDRRQQQAAADGGALAAVQFARNTIATTSCGALTGQARAACRGAEEAIDVIEGTLPGRYQLVGDWDTCTDTAKPADYTQSSTISDCISFTRNLQSVRVVMPGTAVPTYFARVLGVQTINVGALAEARMDINQAGGVIPFAVGPNGSSANQACFFAQAAGSLDIDPCTTSDEGNFGKLNLRLYGNTSLGTPEICSGGTAQRMATNIVLGSDHPIELVGASPGIVNDDTNCPTITNPVDELETWTGNAEGALAAGFIDGIATPSWEGRLMCKGSLSSDTANENPAQNFESQECVTLNNTHPEAIDHTPLWYFLNNDLAVASESGGACTPSISDRAGMEACLSAWKSWVGHTVPLFDDDLADTARFAAVPSLDKDPGGGFGSYWVTGFLPVYLETLYLKCNANTCDIVHSPGEDSDSSQPAACPNPVTSADSSCGWLKNGGNMLIEAMSAFILTIDMLHPEHAKNFPSEPGTIVFNLSK